MAFSDGRPYLILTENFPEKIILTVDTEYRLLILFISGLPVIGSGLLPFGHLAPVFIKTSL